MKPDNSADACLRNALALDWWIALMPGLPVENDQLIQFWRGRPKCKPINITTETIYPFGKGWRLGFVYVHPAKYICRDWGGLI